MSDTKADRESLARAMQGYRAWADSRDHIIRSAYKAGYTGTEIASIMGLARSTVIRARDRKHGSESPELAIRDVPTGNQEAPKCATGTRQ